MPGDMNVWKLVWLFSFKKWLATKKKQHFLLFFLRNKQLWVRHFRNFGSFFLTTISDDEKHVFLFFVFKEKTSCGSDFLEFVSFFFLKKMLDDKQQTPFWFFGK